MSRRMKVLGTNCFLHGDMLEKARELGLKRSRSNQVRIICGCTSMADANRKCEALGLGNRVFTSKYTAETGNKEDLSLAMDGSVWMKLGSSYVNVTELNGGAGIKGTLTIGSNCCTEEIAIHPLQHCDLALTLDDRDRNPGNHIASSLIMFNKNQTWTAYFAWFEDVQEWNVERDCICLRLSDREFSRIFGKYKILPRSEGKNGTKKQDEEER